MRGEELMSRMAKLIPAGRLIRFPLGTSRVHDGGSWGMYYNRETNTTYLAYVVPRGTQITTLPGHYRVNYSFKQLEGYVATRQAYACGECDDDD